MSKDTQGRFRLEHGSAFVTGAAGGIGRELAIGVAAAGAPIACVDRPGSDLQSVVNSIIDAGGRALAVELDVTDDTSIRDGIEQATARLGPLAYAVNAAGINVGKPATELTVEEWNRVIGVNQTGLFLCCRAELAAIEQRGGSIVNIASMSASVINKGQPQAAYYASKGAVRQLTKALAMEAAADGVRVNSISPGYTRTPMLRASREQVLSYEADIPLARLAEPTDLVGPTVFLLSDAAAYVTAHDLLVDGGYTAW